MLLGRVCTKFLLFLYKKVHLFVTRVVKVQQILFDLNFVERKMFCYSSKISSSSQDWLWNFLFPKGGSWGCSLLAIWRDTDPCLIFLNTAMACPWVIPCSTCPLMDKISSPEMVKVSFWVNFLDKIWKVFAGLNCRVRREQKCLDF